MASHFSTLGMPLESEEEFVALAQRAGELAQGIGLEQGAYFHWQDESGAELWLQVNAANEFAGMNPHFHGEGRMIARLVRRVQESDASEFDGGFYAWADPDAEREGEEAINDEQNPGLYPFVFDSPEFLRLAQLELPASLPIQIAAFAHEVEAYRTLADFKAAQTEEQSLTAKCFIPSGLFRPDGTETTLPDARAILAGRILKAERRTNQLTGRDFFAVLVDSHGGTFDCVIDPNLLPELPVADGVLCGSFWLSGRVIVH